MFSPSVAGTQRNPNTTSHSFWITVYSLQAYIFQLPTDLSSISPRTSKDFGKQNMLKDVDTATSAPRCHEVAIDLRILRRYQKSFLEGLHLRLNIFIAWHAVCITHCIYQNHERPCSFSNKMQDQTIQNLQHPFESNAVFPYCNRESSALSLKPLPCSAEAHRGLCPSGARPFSSAKQVHRELKHEDQETVHFTLPMILEERNPHG